jgi:hypothetical protein
MLTFKINQTLKNIIPIYTFCQIKNFYSKLLKRIVPKGNLIETNTTYNYY